MKVSIRPPKVVADNQCFDDDRLNIKFVSNFVDIPDNQEANKTKDETQSGGKQKEKDDKTKKGTKDKASKAAGKGSKNKNISARHWSTSASEQSELESSYDDNEDTQRMSNSNKRTSRTWRRYGSSNVYFDDEESSQSNHPMSSSNDDDEDQARNPNISTDMDSEEDTATNMNMTNIKNKQSDEQQTNLNTTVDNKQSDEQEEQEIVLLYGQIRQIIRGPTVNEPDDVQRLLNVVVAEAEKDKETLSPLIVVRNAPPVIDPVGVDEQCNMTTVSRLNDGGKEDDYGRSSRTTTPCIRSAASRQAGRAAYARAAKMKPYKTQSDDNDRRPLSTKTSTNNVIATPSFTSAPQVPKLRDSVDDVSETSSIDEKGLVVARRTTPLYSRGTSPWLTDQSWTEDHSKGRAAAAPPPPPAAAVASEMSDSASSLLSDVPLPQYSQRQRQQQKHHVPVKRHGRDATTSLSRLPPPNMAEMLSELEYMMARAIAAELPLKTTVDETKRTAFANVATESSMSLPPVLPTSVPPSQLAPCLKYRSAAAGPSSTSQAANPQRRRRIRFASEVKQRTLV